VVLVWRGGRVSRRLAAVVADRAAVTRSRGQGTAASMPAAAGLHAWACTGVRAGASAIRQPGVAAHAPDGRRGALEHDAWLCPRSRPGGLGARWKRRGGNPTAQTVHHGYAEASVRRREGALTGPARSHLPFFEIA
jgi:hypothetical protein